MPEKIKELKIDQEMVKALSTTLHEACSSVFQGELAKGQDAGAVTLGILLALGRVVGTVIAGAGSDDALLDLVGSAIFAQIHHARENYHDKPAAEP